MSWLSAKLKGGALAFAFLTRFPVPASWLVPTKQSSVSPEHSEFGASLFWFPLVGIVLGGVSSAVLIYGSIHLGPNVAGLLALALTTLLTGALHWDGLADSVDGLSAGHRDRARILAAMSDGRIGAHGATALCITMLLKGALFTRLAVLPAPRAYIVLGCVWSALLARMAAAWFVAFLPPAKTEGLAVLFRGPEARRAAVWAALWGVSLLVASYTAWPAEVGIRNLLLLKLCVGLSLTGAFALYWGRYWVKQLGGVTGDLSGALIEVSEVLTIAVWVWT